MYPLVIVHASKIVGKNNDKISQGLLQLQKQIPAICYKFWAYYSRGPACQSSIIARNTSTSTPVKEAPNAGCPILSRLYLILLRWEGNTLPIRKVTHTHLHRYKRMEGSRKKKRINDQLSLSLYSGSLFSPSLPLLSLLFIFSLSPL